MTKPNNRLFTWFSLPDFLLPESSFFEFHHSGLVRHSGFVIRNYSPTHFHTIREDVTKYPELASWFVEMNRADAVDQPKALGPVEEFFHAVAMVGGEIILKVLGQISYRQVSGQPRWPASRQAI
jgi:hypothetical protein